MSARRTLLVARRVATQLRRDHRTLAFLFMVPVLVVFLLGTLLRGGQGDVRVLVATEAGPAEAAAPTVAIAAIVERAGDFTVQSTSEAQGRLVLERGEAAGMLLVSPDGKLKLVLEGTNPQVSEILTRLAQQLLIAAVQLRSQGSPSGPPASPDVAVEVEYVRAGPELDLVDSLAPGLIAYFAYFFVFVLAAVAFLRERTQGTLERLMVTPMGRSEVIAGYMLGFGGFALLQSFLVVGVAVLVLQLHYFGNLVWVFVTVALLTLGAVNVGILVSSFARNEFQAVQFIPVVIIPQGLLCEAFLTLDGMPGWVQALSRIMPMTYAVEIVKEVMVAGSGITDRAVWSGMAILAAFAVAFLTLGAQTLRKKAL